MQGNVTAIERVAPRDGVPEEPVKTAKGYKLGDPRFGSRKHHAENAVFAATLDEAARMIGEGFSLWMGQDGKRPSLISPDKLRVLRKAG